MYKRWLFTIALGLILILAVPALAGCSTSTKAQEPAQVQVNQQPEGIWVSGTGEITVTPDIAALTLGIVTMKQSVADAQAEASSAMASVMQALSDSGIEQKDIQTGRFSISQRDRWDDERQIEQITGYQVSNMVTVKIREIEKIGSIIDLVAQAGGDLIRINGISFSVENPQDYYSEVREKAMTDARNKAEDLAKLAGLTLGKPTCIVEGAQSSSVYESYRSGYGMAVPAPTIITSAPISTGESKITLNVQVTYSTE
ncbi:MAG: SIMPL domain-containing protein [Dehalococcoidales bacterium]|nr:SIMPL domain-containing protein [Dehalococcoidales bacterium]